MPFPVDGEPDYARRPGESPKAFASFTAYRDLPAGTRSVAKAAEALGKSVNTLYGWSVEYRWVSRASAWDDEQDGVACEARLNAIRQANEEQIQIATLMFEAVRAQMGPASRQLRRSPHALAIWAHRPPPS
jgi:hypothetical protein